MYNVHKIRKIDAIHCVFLISLFVNAAHNIWWTDNGTVIITIKLTYKNNFPTFQDFIGHINTNIYLQVEAF